MYGRSFAAVAAITIALASLARAQESQDQTIEGTDRARDALIQLRARSHCR